MVIIFCQIKNLGEKFSAQNAQIRRFLTRCLPIEFRFLTDAVRVFQIFLEILKCSFGHIERSVENPAENSSPKVRKFFCLKSENKYKNRIFSEKTFSPQNGDVE